MNAPTPRLSCRGLALAVPGRTLCAGLDLDVHAGECWAIVGPNGAGKTTLLAALAGLRPPAAGEIAYDGTPLPALAPRERARRRGWLPQDSVDFFPATVLETVLVGRHPHLARWQWETADDVGRAQRALADVGLAGFDARQVGSLSGGERRRVALAALLAQDPDLILLDEPSSHLDLVHQIAALEVLARARPRARQGGRDGAARPAPRAALRRSRRRPRRRGRHGRSGPRHSHRRFTVGVVRPSPGGAGRGQRAHLRPGLIASLGSA